MFLLLPKLFCVFDGEAAVLCRTVFLLLKFAFVSLEHNTCLLETSFNRHLCLASIELGQLYRYAYLQFVMHYSAIYSNSYCCPNSKY